MKLQNLLFPHPFCMSRLSARKYSRVYRSLFPSIIQHFFCPEDSKTEDVFLKIVLPIGAYILVFFLGHFTVMRYLHPFRKTLGNNRMPLNTPVSLLLTGALGYLLYGTYNP